MNAPAQPAAEPAARLSSVTSALHLLQAFSAEQPELGISQLARQLGLAKSTVHRLASTLVAEGFLERSEDGSRYRLGLSLFALGTLVRRRMDVTRQAKAHIDELRDRSNETVHLAALDGAHIVYLFNIESRHAIRMQSYLGLRMPAFCTSEGRALLAYSQPDAVARALRIATARTPHTVTDAKRLRELLEQVRRDGHALDDEESELGMRSIAAPIFDANGIAVAAVGLGGPVQRLTRKAVRALVPMVTATAATITQRMGGTAPGGRVLLRAA